MSIETIVYTITILISILLTIKLIGAIRRKDGTIDYTTIILLILWACGTCMSIGFNVGYIIYWIMHL